MTSQLNGKAWNTGPVEGDRVEVAPFRTGRPFHEYAAFDGSQGIVVGLTQSGARLWVQLEGESKHRSGKKGLPPEILKLVEAS